MSIGVMTSDDIRRVLIRYFVELDRSQDIVQYDQPELEADVNVVDLLLSREEIHDEDYIVFKHFDNEKHTVLDIGANYGYSATSMWRVGLKAAIASFEPIAGFAPILAEIARRKARSQGIFRKLFGQSPYEFYITGLSDEEGEIEFYGSVINGRMQSALTTALKRPEIDGYVYNTCDFAEKYLGEIKSFKIFAFTSPITTVDKWILSRKSKLNLQNIVALKIDTEGFEGHVLRGASHLLKTQKPLVMAESGHHNDLVLQVALGQGYSFAERENDQLRVSQSPTQRSNGFFVHPRNFDFYKSIGLLAI